ncbi:protein arginine kinase [Shouchella lonarensis]|uniref:Protein-arginine kinase n=1 Tax=Shouchella lonarensis TaxID=1464122 RepID=A0A1G6LX43_9BACI|nr:protein arginine kinase [Shouchella lonarensis]SDC47878.1 protein arginine kinase [Shouchella lonarensis]
MSVERFLAHALSPWMKVAGTDDDIVLSSRIRLARNIQDYSFPLLASEEEAAAVVKHVQEVFQTSEEGTLTGAQIIAMDELEANEKRMLVEKHLISPHLAERSHHGLVLLSADESLSVMVNEEDHLRIQCMSPGFSLEQSFQAANAMDDWLESHMTYAFDEQYGYLTSCPTNVGTGLRASVMVHLPALAMTQHLQQILPAINRFGLVVRGIYGEGSEALGNLFQISNQLTLGKTESDMITDLQGVVKQLIKQEREAREALWQHSQLKLSDRVMRSLGILTHSYMIDSKEATRRLSDVRLGVSLGLIDRISLDMLNELVILTQPGFLQQYAQMVLTPEQRDEKRATLIRERLKLS